MPTFTNRWGDKMEVECGGFGGDNVLGTIEEADGSLISGAKVSVANQSEAGEVEDDETSNQGKFDVDVDAGPGDLIVVRASWRDGNGRRHTIVGSFRCPPEEEEEKAARIGTAEERAKEIGRMEEVVEEKLAAAATHYAMLGSLQETVSRLIDQDLNALAGDDDPDEQKKEIDKRIRKELKELANKFETARSTGSVPPAEVQWSILQEMFELLKKLVFKAFLLQGMDPPQLPHGTPGGGNLT